MVRRVGLGMLILIAIGVSGSAVRELIRGTIWLRITDTPLHQDGLHRSSGFQSGPQYKLREMALALHTYYDVYRSFPAGGVFGPDGNGYGSWMSGVSVFAGFEFSDEYRKDEAWNSQNNAKFYRSVIPIYTNPSLPAAPVLNQDGFPLSHFAANQHVMGPNRSINAGDITDGNGNTLFVGEVNSLFQPWGAPTNWRDPMLGLNTSPRGFGSHPDAGGVNFLMVDGSVKFLSNDIDPAVLKALSTPAGGEPVQEGDW